MSASDQRTSGMRWTKNRLPVDLVNAQSFWVDETEFHEPKDLQAMEMRLLKFVHFGEGYLDCSNFSYGPRKHELHDLFCSALPVAMPYVRKLCLRGQHLYQNGATNVSKFLEEIPNLTEIEFCGIDRGMSYNLAFPLEGLSNNKSDKLRKITFNCVDVIDGVELEIFQALGRMNSIKELEVRCCSRWIERNIRRSFSGHQRLESVMMDCYIENEGLADFLASLPSLRSFRSINAVFLLNALPEVVAPLSKLSLCLQHTPLDTFTASLDLVLRRTQNLKELELISYSRPECDSPSFGRALSELPLLESLKVMGSVRCEYLLRCQHLKNLALSTTSELPRGWMEELLGSQSQLESLELLQMDTNIFHDLFQSLQENCTLKSLTVRFKTGDPIEVVSDTAAHQMKRTLLLNKTLTSLTLSLKIDLLPSIVDSLEKSECCFLRYLRLDDVPPEDDSSLWLALSKNTTLRGLALRYRAPRQGYVCEQTWKTILGFIRHNNQITSLLVEPPGRSSSTLAVDDLAIALDRNTTLTSIKILYNPCIQPQFDFVCHLFGSRNRVRNQSSLPKSLWPRVLLSMSPSSIFLTLCHIPLPSSLRYGSKRKQTEFDMPASLK